VRLAESEPGLLIGSDASLDEASRARLVHELLRRIDAVEAHDFDYALRTRYATLKHPGLASQLGPFVRDRSKNSMVRRVAIDMAEECGVVELESQLVDVVLDATETYGTRQQAVAALRKIGSPAVRRRLRPLVTATVPEDVDDELRGYALHALWPDYMTRAELFAALRTPRAPMYYGGYASFLTSLASRLRDEDIADALDWAASHVADSPVHREDKTIEGIVARALHLLSDHAVASAYGRYVAASIRNHHSEQPAGWDRLLVDTVDPSIRRTLLLDLLSLLGKDWIPSDGRLLGPNDFAWIVSQLDSVTAIERRQVIVDAIFRVIQFGVGVEDLDTVLSAAIQHGDLAKGITGFTRAIDINSETAAALRKHQADMAELMKRRERPRLDPPPAERVNEVLERIDGGDSAAFWQLGRELTLEPDSTCYDDSKTQLTSFPGWNAADEATRSRIILAAKRYLSSLRISIAIFASAGSSSIARCRSGVGAARARARTRTSTSTR
jgi:hypothetical protein